MEEGEKNTGRVFQGCYHVIVGLEKGKIKSETRDGKSREGKKKKKGPRFIRRWKEGEGESKKGVYLKKVSGLVFESRKRERVV